MDIRVNIKAQAKIHHITLEEVAKKLDISPVTMYRNIAGNIKLKTLENIAGAIGCNVTDFFHDSTDINITCPHCGEVIHLNINEKPE